MESVRVEATEREGSRRDFSPASQGFINVTEFPEVDRQVRRYESE